MIRHIDKFEIPGVAVLGIEDRNHYKRILH